ncbi:TetR/AcrR family transcriptional regulator [Mycobacterium nebraskense]|uniref:TetR family transcriptional regulator n=1 Tax=Mycobacterium nebraskense TaxID=244292 RepID=A0A1X1ZE89_9MYCO|nr:TetR/AcrR family transcriptional regulator [Mycobacterium nebraskense]KKC04132.1 TetR family transcriptional regulator [Mycobacterium nebraskense]MBI2693628.1 TetR family transcriptional regulator [Mycobacterium nebraskense]MCV7116311.1 TetR family transcriptional regulator [Mycobacterium nebraskense]ORW21704.1 TetR family transcriptional regulator [Mycobacterium nebraskense]
MTAPTNRHELRRRSTHEALRQAALKSFARKGFANVTVTELAREAGVTERTFFRHFPTKEAVLFRDYETQLEWLAEALAGRPASESLFDAVLASVAAFPHDLEVVRQAATARAELISAERIASHLRVVQSSFAQVLTDFVRGRNPDVPNIDLLAEVTGSAMAAALVVAVEHWGRNGATGDLGELVASSLELLRSGLALPPR